MRWTEDDDAVLRGLIGQRLPASEIGIKMGCSRAAIIGRSHRIGIYPDSDKPTNRREARRRRGRPEDDSMGTRRSKPQRRAEWAVPGRYADKKRDAAAKQGRNAARVAAMNVCGDIPIEQRKTFMGLEPGDCRWPVGDPKTPEFFFCGGPQCEGSSYCGLHRAMGTAIERTVTEAEAARRKKWGANAKRKYFESDRRLYEVPTIADELE